MSEKKIFLQTQKTDLGEGPLYKKHENKNTKISDIRYGFPENVTYSTGNITKIERYNGKNWWQRNPCENLLYEVLVSLLYKVYPPPSPPAKFVGDSNVSQL